VEVRIACVVGVGDARSERSGCQCFGVLGFGRFNDGVGGVPKARALQEACNIDGVALQSGAGERLH